MDERTLVLAAVGDLEIMRRQLILELQARDERIAELELELEQRAGTTSRDRDDDD